MAHASDSYHVTASGVMDHVSCVRLMRPASWLMRPASWLMRHVSGSCVMRHASIRPAHASGVRLLSRDGRPAHASGVRLMRPASIQSLIQSPPPVVGHDDNETAAIFHVLMPLDLRLLGYMA